MNTINVNNTIENYLNGVASEAEKSWLLSEMKESPELANEVELRRRTNQILSDRSVLELRSKLETIEMKRRSGGVMRKTALKATRYAAAVACIALISAALYFPLRSTSADKLYMKYYSPYEMPTASRSGDIESNSLMVNAMTSYQAHDYKTAIGYLEGILNSGKSSVESVFMYGMANMEVQNYPVAGGSFREVLNDNNNLYLEDAAWYLGLCYMMNDEIDKALKQFEFISASKSRYSKDARKLVRNLN